MLGVREGRVSRSYGQLCGLALALDAIGDRWTLLIIRELLVRPDGARYTDLRDGLPGIATNLLADRLRDLESVGVAAPRAAPAAGGDAAVPVDRAGRGSACGRRGARCLGRRAGARRQLPTASSAAAG